LKHLELLDKKDQKQKELEKEIIYDNSLETKENEELTPSKITKIIAEHIIDGTILTITKEINQITSQYLFELIEEEWADPETI